MAFADEKIKAGRRPCWVCEIDMTSCSRTYGSVTEEDTIASFNDNLVAYSGMLDDASWTKTGLDSVDPDAVNDPDGVQTADEIIENNVDQEHYIFRSDGAADGASQYTFFARLKANTRTKARILMGPGGFAGTPQADFDLTLGTNTGSADVDSAGIVDSGGGWYTCWLKATSDAVSAAVSMIVYIRNAAGATSYLGDGTSGLYVGGIQLELTSTVNEYQATEDLDGNHTNITITTGGLTIDANVGHDLVVGNTEGALTGYDIVDNGVGWVRVDGDATGESISAVVAIAPTAASACRGPEASGSECYNTRKTCDSTVDFDTVVKTYSFVEPRVGIPPSAGLIPSIRAVSVSPTRIGIREGLGARATASVTFQDHPHHDRGVDDYVANRAYDATAQGTFWGKFLARNPYYQGRVMRLKAGYIGDTFDLANDFETRTYLIERIVGPDGSGRVTISAKDPLKLLDDERARAPAASSGVLDAGIDDAVTTATLSPAGIGNSEYAASGTIRIGSEACTFTRAADVLTIARGTDGTTAATHAAGDSVQECLRYTAQTIDDVIYDLVVTLGGVDASYVTLADWTAETENWLGGHLASALITEPTGIKALLQEICDAYMIYLWWDEVASKIKIAVVAPSLDTPTTLTDAANFVADSVKVQDEPSKRRSQVWLYYDIIDPTQGLSDPTNYRVLYVRIDAAAESAVQYDATRAETVFSRWFTTAGDGLRLGGRLLAALRDNPRTVTFRLDMKDSGSWTGDIVALESDAIQDVDGSAKNTPVRIIEAKVLEGGHAVEYRAVDEAFEGRYFRWGPNTLGDYDAASDEDKRKYGWVSAASGGLSGDDPYKIA